MTDTLEIIAQDNNKCGEGPLWDAAKRRLIWTDIEGGIVYEFVPTTGEKTILSQGRTVAGIALNRAGELVFGCADSLLLWRGPDDFRVLATEVEGESLFFNDILAAPGGRLYGGTVYWGADGKMEKYGKLYLFEPDGTARVVDDGIEMANGLGLSPDDGTLYFADSAARLLYAYDVDAETGTLSNKRVFAKVPTEEGLPDGLTVDSEGYVWNAQWYGSQVVRYAPDGSVERRVTLPVTQVSSVIFGGEDFTDLYVTSAGDSWPSPLAPPGYDFDIPNVGGSLYRLRPGAQGKPEHLTDFAWKP